MGIAKKRKMAMEMVTAMMDPLQAWKSKIEPIATTMMMMMTMTRKLLMERIAEAAT